MISYLLLAVIWSTAFVLWALAPIIAEAHEGAGRGLLPCWKSPYLQTVVGVFFVFLAGGLIASIEWTNRVFGFVIPAPFLLAAYLSMPGATIITLKPQAASFPHRLTVHNYGLLAVAIVYLISRYRGLKRRGPG